MVQSHEVEVTQVNKRDVYSLEKVCLVENFQEEVKIHDSPSTLVIMIIKLEYSLEEEKKHREEVVDATTEENCCVEEALKAFQQEKESRAEDHNTYDAQVSKLGKRVCESL